MHLKDYETEIKYCIRPNGIMCSEDRSVMPSNIVARMTEVRCLYSSIQSDLKDIRKDIILWRDYEIHWDDRLGIYIPKLIEKCKLFLDKVVAQNTNELHINGYMNFLIECDPNNSDDRKDIVDSIMGLYFYLCY